MSSKRYLLILSLFAAFTLGAQTSFWNTTDLGWKEGRNNAWGLTLRTGLTAQIDPESSLEVTDYLDWWSARQDKSKQKFNNRLSIGYYSDDQQLAYGLAYRGTAYGSSEEIFINSDFGAAQGVKYGRKALHQLNADGSFKQSIFELAANGTARLLNTDPVLLYGEPDGELAANLQDYYTRAEFAVKPLAGLRLHAAYDYKYHPLDDAITGGNLEFNYSAVELGAAWEKNFNLNTHLSLSETWQNRNWDEMLPEQANQLISELRLGHHITPELYAFCSYTNRSCFEDPAQDIYLLANYARAQLQYHFPSDPTAGSYVLIGAKLRPANDTAFHPETSAYYAKADYALTRDVYLGAGLNLAPEFLNLYSGRLSYHLDSFSEIHLELLARENKRAGSGDSKLRKGISIGTEVHF